MQVTILFNLPDEESELQAAIEGMDHLGAIREFRERSRSLTKYGHGFQTVDEALSSLYHDYCSIMEKYL